MFKKDPIQDFERTTKNIHDNIGKYTKPVLRRYPLTFSFLIVFSIAAILHGFEIFTDQISFFKEHPTILIFIGVLTLFFTGTLYKSLR